MEQSPNRHAAAERDLLVFAVAGLDPTLHRRELEGGTMLRRSVIVPTRTAAHLLEDDAFVHEAPLEAEWLRKRLAGPVSSFEEHDEELGVRALLDHPDAQERAWRTTERSRSPGRRHRDRRERAWRSKRG